MSWLSSCCASILLVLLLMVGSIFAQVTIAVIHGNVTDESGGVIPGATVTARNVETGGTRATVTNESGYYTFEALQAGIYDISAEMPGFNTYLREGAELSVGARIRIDVTLQVGEVTETTTVTGGAVMVDTRSAEVSALVDDKRITDLPLSGRNVIGLASLLPGISTVQAPQAQTGSRDGPVMTVHGGRDNQNYFTLDGSYFTHPSRNTGMNPPPPDAVREFRIKTNNFSAAEGRNSGAVVSVVTRSGTNQLRGSLWEFHRNDDLNARNFFAVSKEDRTMNQFGAAVGGPIIKDRVHVFGSYEGFRDRPQPATTGAFPPTAAERAGDFSHVSQQLVNPYTSQPFANNQVDPSLFDPVSLRLLDFIPLPNAPDGRLVTNNPESNDNDLLIFRNDIQITANQSLFWHYYYNTNHRPPRLTGDIPGWMDFSAGHTFHNVSVSHTWTLSPNLVNSFTLGYNYSDQFTQNDPFRSAESLGLDFPNYTSYGSPRFGASGRFSLNAVSEWNNTSKAYNFHEAMSWVKGDHVMKFGAEYFRLTFSQAWLSPPLFDFNGQRSGDPMLDFMMGAWRTLDFGWNRRANDNILPWYWSFYFQDEWRAASRLTLTLGLRYELASWWNDQRELALSTFVLPLDKTTSAPIDDPPPGYLFANYDLPAGIVKADKNNVAPRIGLAYDVSGDGRTSLRAGGGIFYDAPTAETMAQVNPPFAGSEQFFNGRLDAPKAGVAGPLPPTTFEPGAPIGFFLPTNAASVDMNLATPYSYHWNLGLQHQLTDDIAVSGDYIGKIGRKWISSYPWNPAVYVPGTDADGNPLSTLENVNERVLYGKGILDTRNLMLASMFDSSYHGAEFTVNKRMSGGVTVLANYTFSKAITDKSARFSDTSDVPNPFQIKESKRGLATFDRTHVLNVSALLSPYAHGGPAGFVGALLRNWTFAPIFQYRSGQPLELFLGEDRALDGTAGSQHPVAVRNPTLTHDTNISKITQWFDTDALALPEIGTYGNAGVGLVRGPSYVDWSLGVMRDFVLPGILSEENRIQFRAEFFNLFNNTNLENPNTTFTSSSFGRITSAGASREIQFGLKFIW
ncbi:MAG: hypothetical protein GEU99_07835 [Luteitalea sp.]|nr:hypothetical protein [Luteitalea sp.]